MIKKLLITCSIFLIVINAAFGAYDVHGANYHWAGNSAQNVAQIFNASKIHSKEYKHYISDSKIDELVSSMTYISNIEKLTTAKNWYTALSIIFDIDISEKIEYLSEEQLITREEAISYLMKQIISKYGKPEKLKSDYFNKFKDLNKLNLNNSEYMKIALNEGIISGFGDASIRPKDFLRNAEAVIIVERICGWYQLPQSQWKDSIRLVNEEDSILELKGIDMVNEASWSNDNSIILAYNNPVTYIREASKLNVNNNSSVVAFKYDKSNIGLSFLNRSAFKNEKGYISANSYIWSNIKKYVNGEGELKEIQVPYTNYWVSENKEKIFIQNNKNKNVKIFDFINEKEVELEKYYYWADSDYSRSIKWSPDSKYIICNLFKPDDDIGIGIKNRFAVFNSETGELVKVIMNYDSYSFYPVWSPDSKKIAFLSVDIADNNLKYALSNMIESKFNLPATKIGIYNLENDEINYYKYDSVIFGKYENSIIWSKDSSRVFFESALDNIEAIYKLNKELEFKIEEIPNKITMLNTNNGEFKDITIGGEFSVNPSDVWFEDEDPVNYIVTKQLLSISPDNKKILYKKTFKNVSYYENVSPKYSLLDLEQNKEFEITDRMLKEYWWLNNGKFVYVDTELPSVRRAKITFNINEVNNELENRVLSTFTQYNTKITISPNKKYLLLHDYRGLKQIKLLKIS